ncbi:MAG: nitrous oxide reductase family maturation protein NosD [Promethearchaeota archaeon]
MKKRMKDIYAFLMLFLIIFSISTHYNLKNSIETSQEDFKDRITNLKLTGFWSNFTFIHITNLNWTIANETDWCSGSGTWGDPYLIENLIINASASPIDCGIFIENSIDVYFKIRNVTIFDTTNGIKLENTNKGTLINNEFSENTDSGIYMVNCVNNTVSRNKLVNNGVQGLYLFSNCLNNKIIGNTIKNDGTNFQDTGIYIGNNCDDNEILGNFIYDNNMYGINMEDLCERNLVYNNTVMNIATSQQDWGIRLDNDCHQNNISLNLFEDLNNYGIYLVTSDQNYVSNNQIININIGMYMLIAHQTEIINNTISGGSSAILMSACDGGKILRNLINNTGTYAIRLYINCDDNEFHDNIIKDNVNYGIQLYDPSDINNKFFKNSFISNGIHAYDNGTTTSWNNTMVGNYWDNYTGLDLNNDHIGDTPFNILGNAKANDSLPIVDHGPPNITINAPIADEYNATAPEFNIFVNDPFIYSMWYKINNSGIRYYFTKNETINQDAWSALNNGNLTITFYARDIAWNVGSTTIDITKGVSQGPGDPDDPDDGPPPINIVLIVVISIIVIAAIVVAGILMRSLPKKGKITKSRKLDEEQLSKAQYFKDITSILTVLAIHNESGLCLSKLALHGGIGLDEHLFTGFISAMGSFKNELAKQMGLRVRGEGGDNIIEYNEFTITLMDGEYLRLGLVSYSNLGDLVKRKCGQALRAYEIKHINDLTNFEGEIQVFNDFEEIIEAGLDLNLNRKSIINVKQLNKYDAPESFKTILNDFNSRSVGFYPAEITSTLEQEMNISEQEAYFMVYDAYLNQIFLPTKLEK